jgi:hypothetical protein
MSHNSPGPVPHSQLFIVRLWQEAMGSGVYETRSQVRHVPSGEVCHFRAWADLVAYLSGKIEPPSVCSPPVCSPSVGSPSVRETEVR